jgi:hypothetical protein
VAGALGLAVLSTFATNHTNSLVAAHHALNTSLLSGYRLAYVLGIASVLIGAGIAVALLRSRSATGVAVSAEPSEVPADATGADAPRVVGSGAQDQDLGTDIPEQPGEVLLA